MSQEELVDKNATLITEVLAYALAGRFLTEQDPKDEADWLAKAWRSDRELRIKWRAEAQVLQEELLTKGARLRTSSHVDLTKAVREMSIQPAFQVYDVLAEIKGK